MRRRGSILFRLQVICRFNLDDFVYIAYFLIAVIIELVFHLTHVVAHSDTSCGINSLPYGCTAMIGLL